MKSDFYLSLHEEAVGGGLVTATRDIEFWDANYWNFKALKIHKIWLCENEGIDRDVVLIWDGDWQVP